MIERVTRVTLGERKSESKKRIVPKELVRNERSEVASDFVKESPINNQDVEQPKSLEAINRINEGSMEKELHEIGKSGNPKNLNP